MRYPNPSSPAHRPLFYENKDLIQQLFLKKSVF
jgi:hypothetical protein